MNRQNRVDSLRALGKVSIAVDYPTRQRLQKTASSQGVTVAEWVRVLSNVSIDGGKQGQLADVSHLVASAGLVPVQSVDSKLDRILSKFDAVLNNAGHTFLTGFNERQAANEAAGQELKANLLRMVEKMAEAIKNAPEQKELGL